MYASGSINDSVISVGAGISYAKLNLGNAIKSSDIDPNNRIQNNKLVNSTISGVSLGSNLLNLVAGSYIDGGSYNGSGIVTFSIRASVDNVANTLVARDANGNVNIQGANFNGSIPIGGIIMWSGATVPSSWALCNGATVNGVVTPDLRDRFIVGSGSAYNIGNTGGANAVTLSIAQMPAHAHGGVTNTDFPDHAHNIQNTERKVAAQNQTSVLSYNEIGGAAASTSGATARHQHPINAEGGSTAHENRPPYYALAFIMRVQ
jgi:microcystin-dependent protein